jgi:amino acid adenylation domain-containing protein
MSTDRPSALDPRRRALLEAMLRQKATQGAPASAESNGSAASAPPADPADSATVSASAASAESAASTGSADSTTLTTSGNGAGRPAWSRIQPVPRDGDALPASFAQERLWFLHQLQPASPAYTIPLVTRITSPLSVPAMERAIFELIRRHEPLRTTFRPGPGGRPVQVIHPPKHIPIEVVDLRALEPRAREEEAQRRIAEEARKPFDLAAGPLMRTLLVRMGDADQLLMYAMHHIVSDAWSMNVFFRELTVLYTAAMSGRPQPLPPLAVQYADFAVWQREYLSGDTLQEQLAYWREHLRGAPPVVHLPTDRPRPPTQSFRGSSRGVVVPARTMNRLRAISQQCGATLFMTLLAGFATLLHRLGAGDDLVVGSPIAARTRAELEGLIGFFVNTLVLRTDLSGDPSFLELLERVKNATLGAFAHQDVPFEKLVEELQPERNLSHNPLFQVLFVMQPPTGNPAQRTADADEPEMPPPGFGNEAGTAKFDLTLAVAEMGQALVGGIEYALDLFDGPTIDRLSRYYTRLLAAVAERPDAPISTLELMDDEERRMAVEGWQGEAAGFDPLPLHALFDRQADAAPDAVALVHGADSITYDDLRRRANRLAHRLRALGMGPERIAGVCLERTPDLVVALLAVMKAGGAYVPLDPAYPRDRIAFMLRDSGARVVITSSRLRGMMEDADAPVLCVDEAAEAIAAEPEDAPETGVLPENLAYVIYTSGSTGRPKGVAIQHRSAAAMAAWARRAFGFAPGTAMLAGTSVCFDLSVFELFASLAGGLRIVLADNVLALPSLPARDSVEVINSVPSVVGELLKAGPLPASVHTVVLAGEPLPAPLVQALYRHPHVRAVVNAYGPSEDTTYSTWTAIHPADPYPPIGRPVDDTRGYVLDRGLRPVPQGVLGELHLSGEGLARGYLGRPALTAERFVPDPLGPVPGARMYRTGDLCRHRPDGTLDYLGRADQQVKVRGFRVELGEVEAVLSTHPALAACAVTASRTGADRRLAAYTVARESAEAPAAELRAWLRERLPEHMVPSVFVTMEALPLTPSGKVDRGRLPEPEAAGSGDAAYVAPRTPQEAALAGIWREILQVPRVGAEDDFFELGGHSLMATQVLSRMRETFGVELPLPAFFERPTVAALAALVETGAAAEAPIPRADDVAAAPADPGPAEVAHLSDEEVLRLLLQAANGGNGADSAHPPASAEPTGPAETDSAGSIAPTGIDAAVARLAGIGAGPGASVDDLSDDEVTAMLTRLMTAREGSHDA